MIAPDTRLRRAIHLRSASLVNHVICSNLSTPHLIRNHDVSDKGNTSLHLAAKLGLVEVAEVLLSHGHESDGFSRNSDGASALMLACRAGPDEEDETAAGMIAVGKLLILNYPDMIKIRDHDGWNAFHHAARYGTNALLTHFLALSRDLIDPIPVSTDNNNVQEKSSSRPSSPSTPPSPTSQTPQQETQPQSKPQFRHTTFPPRKDSLQGATQWKAPTPKPSRPVSTTTITPAAHPLITATTTDGNTALHQASAFGHLKTLRLLISAGADAGARNTANWSPLDYSASVQAEVYLRSLIREKETRDTRGSAGESEETLIGDAIPRPSLSSILPSQVKPQRQPPIPTTTTPAAAISQSEGFVGPSRSRGFIGPGQTKSYMGNQSQLQTQAQSSPTRSLDQPPRPPALQRSPAKPNFSLTTPTPQSPVSSVGFSSINPAGAQQRRAEPGRFYSRPGVRLVQSEGSGDESDDDSDEAIQRRSRAAT